MADNFFRPWSQLAIDIIPSMLSFSLGGMAIMLAFAGAKNFEHLSQKGKPESYFIKVVANFFHFVLFQTFALFFAFISKSYPTDLISGIGFWFLSYSILVGIAIAGQLFNTARVFNSAASLPDNEKNKSDK